MRLTKNERFFYDHAGYSYDPKTETAEQGKLRCAQELAKAEQLAQELNWSCEWVWDDSGCGGCDCGSDDCACSSGTEHETLGCVLKNERGEQLDSLWGICGADNSYRRVVEAELASEAITHLNNMRVSAFAEPL